MNAARGGGPGTAPVIEIVVQSPRWKRQRGVKAVLRRAIEQAAAAVALTGEIAIVLTDDSAIRALNRRWRRKDEPTNVLSFPAIGPRHRLSMHPNAGRGGAAPALLGDIVIAYETAARE